MLTAPIADYFVRFDLFYVTNLAGISGATTICAVPMIKRKLLNIFDDHTHTPRIRGTFQALLSIGLAVHSSRYFFKLSIWYVIDLSRVPDTSKDILPGGDGEKSLGSELHERQASVF